MNERKTDWILIEHLQTRFEVRRNRERTNLYGGIGYILHPSIDEANLIFYLKKEENTLSSKISNDFSNCEESSLIF